MVCAVLFGQPETHSLSHGLTSWKEVMVLEGTSLIQVGTRHPEGQGHCQATPGAEPGNRSQPPQRDLSPVALQECPTHTVGPVAETGHRRWQRAPRASGTCPGDTPRSSLCQGRPSEAPRVPGGHAESASGRGAGNPGCKGN